MSKMLVTIAYGSYWDLYGSKFELMCEALDEQPHRIVVITDKPVKTKYENIVFIPDNGLDEYALGAYRQKALDICDCDWLIQFDIDDIMYPNYISNLNNDADWHVFLVKGNEYAAYGLNAGIDNFYNLKILSFGGHMNSAFKTAKLREIGGFKTNFGWEDIILVCDLIHNKSNIYIDHNITRGERVFTGSESITKAPPENRIIKSKQTDDYFNSLKNGNKMNNKPIKFITTFSETGYDLYGKTWLETFKNVMEDSITAEIYLDFNIPPQNNVKIINYDNAIPQHNSWVLDFESNYSGAPYNKKMGVRFSYKSFVMQHALKNNSGCYVIWLDGDCIFKPNQNYSKFAEELLNGKFIAVQRERFDNNGNDHCESGIVIFDTDHKDKQLFLDQFINNYKIENIIQMGSPYDGFIIYKSLNGIDYTDLNYGYGRDGVQSDPNETFLHPEINKRFLHNIGATGKSKYPTWSIYSKTDEYYKLIQGKVKKTPEEIMQIRKQLLQRRNAQ